MPVPKKRQSKSKSNTRKSVWKEKALKEIKRAFSKKKALLEAIENIVSSKTRTRQGRGFAPKQVKPNTPPNINRRRPKRNKR